MTAKASAESTTQNANVNAPKIEKNQPSEQEKVLKAILTPSAEQRLKNLKNFQLLSERFEHLKQKEDELNTFCVSNDSMQEKIKITNGSGITFSINNSQVIEDVVNLIGKHLKGRIDKTEKEIIEFTI